METTPFANSLSSSVIVMVIGWVLFTITLIVCGILVVWIIMRRHPNNKYAPITVIRNLLTIVMLIITDPPHHQLMMVFMIILYYQSECCTLM